MPRYVGYVARTIMDDLFEYGPGVWELFQEQLHRLEAEPYKGSLPLPADRSNDPGWTTREAKIRKVISLEGRKYTSVVRFKVGPTQLKVHGFHLVPVVETEEGS